MLFAENLRRRAEVLGLSNAEVARRAGLTERRYGNYVVGRREPDLTTLVRIAQTLSMTVDELLSDNSIEGAKNPLRERLLVAANDLPDTDLEGLVVQAEALALRRFRKT